jgi:hypothetical protein
MAPEEKAALQRLARLCLGLVLGSAVIIGSSIAMLVTWQVPKTIDVTLCVTNIFLSSMTGAIACLIFLSRGGASSHHAFLGVLLPILYVYTLMVLYFCLKLGIYLSSKAFTKMPRRGEFLFAVIVFWISGLVEIITSLRLPRLLLFLKDFKELPRSRSTKLSDYVFLTPPTNGPNFPSSVHDDDDDL